MKPREIKGVRTRLGYTQQEVADRLGISVDTYRKKEKKDKFTDPEKVILTKLFGLTAQQVNDFFFDGQLPIGNAIKATR